MKEIKLQIAELYIQVSYIYPSTAVFLQEYEVKDAEDMEVCHINVEVTLQDILLRRKKFYNADVGRGVKPQEYSNEYLETLVVLNKIAIAVLDHGILYFHGSCLSVDEEGFLFAAKSGTGKSTHAELWRKLLGKKAVMVNDDKPFLKIGNGKVIAYGTPWMGKHRLGENTSVRLKAVCILTRSNENKMEKITKSEGFAPLLQQAYRPLDEENYRKVLKLVDGLLNSVEIYTLSCNMDITAAELAYNTMKGAEK